TGRSVQFVRHSPACHAHFLGLRASRPHSKIAPAEVDMLGTQAVGSDRDAFRWRHEGTRMQRAHGVGRLSFVRRDADTVIKDCYQEAGLRIRLPRPGPSMPIEAVIINTA